ncbi:MAG TPA: dicarboxylate/amino acid:cation symporter [Planctomycetota bacterium]|nr:dicarboxylate/amino acid:cation symporter [Planctomycetota bacterium]
MEIAPRRRLAPSTRILIGLLIGAAAGTAMNLAWAPEDPKAPAETWAPAYRNAVWFADKVAHPAGQVFLRMLFMTVVPLVFCSLVLGVAGLGGKGRLGWIGVKVVAWFLGSTLLAVLLGLFLVNAVRPGDRMDPERAKEVRAMFDKEAAQKEAQAKAGSGFDVDTYVNIIPRNIVRAASDDRETLGVIFFAILIGVAAARRPPETTRVFLEFLQTFYDLTVAVLGFAMKLAPYGVAGLIFAVTLKLGFDVMRALGAYLGVAIFGLLFHQFVVLGAAVALLVRLHPVRFFGRIRGLMATAFSTSSSNATLPTTIRTATDEFGVSPRLAGFVMPLGATMNMNGTALFEGVTVLFLAQVADVRLGLAAQAVVLLLSVLTAIGAAGVPGGSLPLLAVVLDRVGVEPGYLALILGVDRIVDMTRTVPNVCSDLIGCLWVARTEGEPIRS